MFTATVLLLCSCTYHAKIRPDIYKESDRPSKISASVLLLADQHIPAEILITDTENSDTQSFLLQTREGVTAALTKALETLFQQVAVENHQTSYDFVAAVKVEAGLTRNNCEGELAKWAVRKDGLCTIVTLSLRRENNEKPVTVKSSKWREFRTPGFASSVRWLNKHTFIFSPVLTPIYMQSQGGALRKQFEDNLTDTLTDIILQLEEKRALLDTH